MQQFIFFQFAKISPQTRNFQQCIPFSDIYFSLFFKISHQKKLLHFLTCFLQHFFSSLREKITKAKPIHQKNPPNIAYYTTLLCHVSDHLIQGFNNGHIHLALIGFSLFTHLALIGFSSFTQFSLNWFQSAPFTSSPICLFLLENGWCPYRGGTMNSIWCWMKKCLPWRD